MPESESTIDRLRELADHVAGQFGLELWDLELAGSGRGRTLRVYLDKSAGVTLEDCERFSRQFSALLDAENVIPGAGYLLEASSPGWDRVLKRPDHFQRFAGQRVRLTLHHALPGGQRNLTGRLESADAAGIELAPEAPGIEPLRLAWAQFHGARLAPRDDPGSGLKRPRPKAGA